MSEEPSDPKAKKRKLRLLPGLDAEGFRHPNDARATEALHKLPGLTLYRTHPFAMQRAKTLDTTATARRASRL